MPDCPVCEHAQSISIERRAPVPIAQNLIFPTRQEALECPAGALDIRRCVACGFVWNAAFDPELLVYDAAYDNDQNFSPRFRHHVETVADAVVSAAGGVRSVDLLEVGCGQGSFMAILAEKLDRRLHRAIGFDPAWKGDASGLPPRLEIRGDYLAAGWRRPDDSVPDIVVSRHVIEHVPDPIAFLRAIRAELAPGTPILIETPDVEWVLHNGVFFDLYYEHCSLFTPASLALALERSGFAVDSVAVMFDGQYQLARARASDPSPPAPGGNFDDLGYGDERDGYLRKLSGLIDDGRSAGKVALWGGASKGVTICLTLPDAPERIDCVIDINDRKQGCFLPTSGIPVVSPAEAWARGVRSVIVVNPAYLAEIRTRCADEALAFELIAAETD